MLEDFALPAGREQPGSGDDAKLADCREGTRMDTTDEVRSDWRHMSELQDGGEQSLSERLNLVVRNNTSPGQGSFYRSQHEP